MTFISLMFAIGWLALLSDYREKHESRFTGVKGFLYEVFKLTVSVAIAFSPDLIKLVGI